MRSQLLLLLAMTFMFFIPGPVICGVNTAGHPAGGKPPVPGKLKGTCETIAAILAVYPALEVRKSEGPVRVSQDIPERSGCRVFASGPASGVAGEIDPAESVRVQFRWDGWIEDTRLAADGPGTSSFAFRKNGVLCMVSGGAHSWIEDGKTFTSERYDLKAACVPDNGAAAPGR
jgi:hypothetical protein